MDYIPLQNASRSSHRRRFWYHAFVHTLSVLLAATAVALFPAFSYKPWSLATTHSLKTTQQYLNFIVIASALAMSWLLQHCLAITNNTEVEAEFASKSLSLAALQARAAANGKDVIDMLRYASHNARLWKISGPFAVAIFAFSAMSWVLSIVFVIDAKLMPDDELSAVQVSLGADIPTLPDACRSSLTAEGCTYDLAMSALTSQLITHTPYTFNNVTFSGAEGTRALPVGAMKDFADRAVESDFGQERSKYCLPLMRPNLVNCSTADEGRAKYVYINTQHDTFLDIPYDTYSVIINPDSDKNQTYVLTSSNGDRGVMVVAHSEKKGEIALSILTGSGQYADLLSRLATGQAAPFTKEKYNETTYTVVCEAPFDDTTYSWNWVEFTLNGGVMTANLTNQTCRENEGKSPMVWLDYALEGATSSAQLRDGYSKLLNTDYLSESGDDYERMKAYNMTPLEYILSHIEAIVMTAWTATNADIAPKSEIKRQIFEHRYVVNVEISGVTILALCVACLILLCTILQAVRWLRAERRAHSSRARGPHWQLLDPVQLLIYGAAAADSVAKLDLSNEKQRAATLRNRKSPMLGFGAGTMVPLTSVGGTPATRSSAFSSHPGASHTRNTSEVSLVHAEEELPDWNEVQTSYGRRENGSRSPPHSRDDVSPPLYSRFE